ncbi:MAG TPA: CBS and ACT domain-containing protein [Trueperaceae bacterium]|nr:CBS and ACT domain-containing protein [Trueperaceae bacterium]
MLVQDIMTRKVVAIGPDMPIRDVCALMEQRNIRHFPILESAGSGSARAGARDERAGGADHLVGIVSDRDLRLVGADHPLATHRVAATDPVREVMVTPVLTAHPLDPIEETAKVLREHKIGAMPVMDGPRLVGIITGIDMLDALIRMSGVHEAATRLEVEVPNRPGELASLLAAIAARKHNVSSVMTSRSDAETVTFVLRVNTVDGRGLASHLRKAGFVILWPVEKTTES